jgi:uncharacterized glyoxalase superfamily protein PhnB
METPKETSSNARLIGSAPYFMVRDLARALDYYCDVLGFARPPLFGNPPTFAMPKRDGFIVMLYQTESEAPVYTNKSQGGAWDAYFWVSDADGLYEEFRAKGAQIEYEPCVQEYEIKEFAVRDTDGHVLAFGQHWPAGT